MRIALGADHAGVDLKREIRLLLDERGIGYQDFGTNNSDSVDYPDYAHQVAEMVARGETSRGVLLCGTGLGMSYAANRYHGVRAAVAWTPEIAHLSREHNDSNVLVLPARFLDEEDGVKILKEWLATPFAGGRHARRVAKIEETGPDA